MVVTCAPESIKAVHSSPSTVIVPSLVLPINRANGSGL